MLQDLQPFVISFFIGLLIGIERERSHPEGSKAMGVRSFTLMALLGTLITIIKNPALDLLVGVFALSIVLIGYYRSAILQRRAPAIGITTELSAAIVFCLGYLAPSGPLLSAILGCGVLFILLARKQLHRFSRNALHANEIRAATTILIIGIGVLPFLPNYTIDPWHLFNPWRFGMLVFLIAAIQFGGYIAIRLFDERLGMLLVGFLGGLISSTIVYATLPHVYNNDTKRLRPCVAAAIVANIGMLIEFLIIIAAVSPLLMHSLLLPFIAMILTGLLSVFFLVHNEQENGFLTKSRYTNPLDLKAVLRLSIIIFTMILLIGAVKNYLGAEAVKLVAFLGGLFELHSVSIATANLYVENKLTLADARITLLLAILASYVTKFVLLGALARNRFAALTSLLLMITLLAGAAFYYVSIYNVTL